MYCRLILSLVFFTAGFSKLAAHEGKDFASMIGPVWLEERLAEYGLGLFARFIAYCQLGMGLCFFIGPLRTIAALMLLPMLLGILAVTISLHWAGTPLVVSALLLMNVYLLLLDWPKFKLLIHHGSEMDSYLLSVVGVCLILASVILLQTHPAIYHFPLLLGLACQVGSMVRARNRF